MTALKTGKDKLGEVSWKKLCLVIPSLHSGGMQRVMSELAGYFCKNNKLELHLVLYGREPKSLYNLPNNLVLHVPKLAFNNRFRLFYNSQNDVS